MPLAYLLINCEHGEEQGIIEELKELPEIVEAYQIAGAYDLIAKINAATIDKLKETIRWRIRTTDKIKSTTTPIAIACIYDLIEGKS